VKQRNLIISGAIFLVLLIYVLFTQTGNKGFNTLKLPALPKITSEEMEKITITKPEEQIVLIKQDKNWQITEPFSFPAEKSKTDSLRRMLSEIRLTNLVTERAEAEADYGLTTTNAITLKIQGAGNKLIELVLGNANENSTHTYVQLPGDSKIYQLLGDFTQQLRRSAKEWRSLCIYEFTTDVVRSVSIAQKGKPILIFSKEQEVQEEIVKDSAQKVSPTSLPTHMVWKVKGKGTVLNDPKVNRFLNAFTRLAANKIADGVIWDKKPMARVKVETVDKVYELEILTFLKKQQRYRVRRAGENVIYEISKYQGDNLLKTEADFK